MGLTCNIGRDSSNSGERSVAAEPDRGRVRTFTSAGGAKPIAGRGGLEGFTPPHRFKARTAASDGQYAFTRAARSAGLNFAVILLSKAMDVGRDHLIHRGAVPLPRKDSEELGGRSEELRRLIFEVFRPIGKVTPQLRRRLSLPLEGKGDRVSGG